MLEVLVSACDGCGYVLPTVDGRRCAGCACGATAAIEAAAHVDDDEDAEEPPARSGRRRVRVFTRKKRFQ